MRTYTDNTEFQNALKEPVIIGGKTLIKHDCHWVGCYQKPFERTVLFFIFQRNYPIDRNWHLSDMVIVASSARGGATLGRPHGGLCPPISIAGGMIGLLINQPSYVIQAIMDRNFDGYWTMCRDGKFLNCGYNGGSG